MPEARLDQAKDSAVRHQPTALAPGPYASDPVALAFAAAHPSSTRMDVLATKDLKELID